MPMLHKEFKPISCTTTCFIKHLGMKVSKYYIYNINWNLQLVQGWHSKNNDCATECFCKIKWWWLKFQFTSCDLQCCWVWFGCIKGNHCIILCQRTYVYLQNINTHYIQLQASNITITARLNLIGSDSYKTSVARLDILVEAYSPYPPCL